MSATNTTTHYNLPSFVATDKPAWLVDWNGAMASIDAGIYQAQQKADTNTADISGVQGSVTTLAGTVESQGLTISTLSQSLTTAIGNINTINSLIGNGTPTTTDQTIIGAINEINARTGKAEGISYDNADSGLTATNVQSAIDENADAIITLNSALTNIFISNSNYTYLNQTIPHNSSYTVPATGIYMFVLSGDLATASASMYFDSARTKTAITTQAPNTAFIIPLQKDTTLYTKDASSTTYRVFYYVSN